VLDPANIEQCAERVRGAVPSGETVITQGLAHEVDGHQTVRVVWPVWMVISGTEGSPARALWARIAHPRYWVGNLRFRDVHRVLIAPTGEVKLNYEPAELKQGAAPSAVDYGEREVQFAFPAGSHLDEVVVGWAATGQVANGNQDFGRPFVTSPGCQEAGPLGTAQGATLTATRHWLVVRDAAGMAVAPWWWRSVRWFTVGSGARPHPELSPGPQGPWVTASVGDKGASLLILPEDPTTWAALFLDHDVRELSPTP
jgi:hypothetical protein